MTYNSGKDPDGGVDKFVRAAWHMQIEYVRDPQSGKTVYATVTMTGTGACTPRNDPGAETPVDIAGMGAAGGNAANFQYSPDDPLIDKDFRAVYPAAPPVISFTFKIVK